MPDDPHFIPPAERAEGEAGEGGCRLTEAEERKAAEPPDILAAYYALVNPPPDQPTPSPARMDMVVRGEDPRAPLKARFDQALRRGEWVCFGFDVAQGRRVQIRSPWREELRYEEGGGLIDGVHRTHLDVLFYRVGVEQHAPSAGAPAQEKLDKDQPRDTSALRLKAKTWLAQFVDEDKHVDRDDTLKKMRAKHPGLGVRGSLSVFRCYSAEHPELKLSAPGRKSKRNTNN